MAQHKRRGSTARSRRQEGARERQAEREARGDMGQLQKLITMGAEHCREAVRLRERLGTA